MEIRQDIALYGKQALERGALVAGQAEVTTRCFQKCPQCSSWKEGVEVAHVMPPRILERLFGDLMRVPTFETLSLTGGDPQAYPYLEEVVRFYASFPENARFALRMSTTLVKPPQEFYRYFSEVRISFDAIKEETYEDLRGVDMDPLLILNNVNALRVMAVPHSFLITVNELNWREVPDIVAILATTKPRKISILCEICENRGRQMELFGYYTQALDRVRRLQESNRHLTVPVSYAETAAGVYDYKEREKSLLEVPCRVGTSTFHLKASGDVYPCCLVGGEAIPTRTEFKLFNLHDHYRGDPTTRFYSGYFLNDLGEPELHYKKEICRHVCQYKQLCFNLAGHQASKTRLAMP